ncbi:MAG: LEA type 2 family protein [Paludibacteraceae bacterium]|nr:LEA type 2 family protein [Paludibacteraceae bacterium]
MKLTKYLFLMLTLALLTGCASVKGLKNFASCDFDFKSVSNVRLANVDVSNIKSYNNLSLKDTPKLLAAFAKKELNLNFNVNVDVKNPNSQTARLDGLDYILWIDNAKILTGSMNKQMSIGANQSGTLALPFSFNLFDFFSGKSSSKMISFALGLATNSADNSRVKVSIKPYFAVGKQTIKLPAYVTVGGDKIMPKQ